MKRTILIITVLFASIIANAQDSLVFAVFPGDTVELTVTGANGTIQWQESIDSIVWTNIIGATTTPYELITTSSATGKYFYRAEVSDTLCPNASPFYSSIIRHRIINSTNELQIGNWFHGGVVFYFDGSGGGCVAPQFDQTNGIFWGCPGVSIPGATSTSDGEGNTTAIVSSCLTNPIAASICDTLGLYGYEDWYLPSKDELNYLYMEKDKVGGFDLFRSYWSSTEIDASFAWIHYFEDGSQINCPKDGGSFPVRSIRSFSNSESISKTFCSARILNQPSAVEIINHPISQIVCLGNSSSFYIIASGTSLAYQWKKDGMDITGETDSLLSLSNLDLSDEGIFTCEISNMCNSVATNDAELKVIQLVAYAGPDTNICIGDAAHFHAAGMSNHTSESGSMNYIWSPVEGLSDPYIADPDASLSESINYSITVTDQLGCADSDSLSLFVQDVNQNQQICLVSVDPVVGKNKIMWEKTPDVGTDSYVIQKEISTGIYGIIGTVPAQDTSYFIDYASQPESHGDKYKITLIDTCGNQSDIDSSAYHKTINLTIAAFGSTMGLNWDYYEVEDASFVPSKYYIYRGTTPFNLQLIDSVTGSFNSYNDVNVYSVYYYMVGAIKQTPCDLNVMGQPVLMKNLFSNKKDNSGFVGIYADKPWLPLSIYPNPFKESTTIQFSNPNKSSYTIHLTDITGKTVIEEGNITDEKVIIQRNELSSGVYMIELIGEKNYKGKLVIN